MDLSQEQQLALGRGDRAKEFLEGEFWRDELFPELIKRLSQELPKPDKEGWEKQYISFWALSNAADQIRNILEGWVSEADRVRKVASTDEPSIMEA